MRSNENKNQLFCLAAEAVTTSNLLTILVKTKSNFVTSITPIDIGKLEPRKHGIAL